jgi:hypothetical protein
MVRTSVAGCANAAPVTTAKISKTTGIVLSIERV